MGAFFAGMTIRATSFPPATTWTPTERHVLHSYWPRLRLSLPPEVLFIADPQGSLFDDPTPTGPR